MSNTIELDFKADNFEEAISQAIVAALGSGMCPREIIAQLISRGFLRDPGDNAPGGRGAGISRYGQSTAPRSRNADWPKEKVKLPGHLLRSRATGSEWLDHALA